MKKAQRAVRRSDEIERRELVARRAVQRAFETADGEWSARLFVTHHLAELDPAYWRRHLSVEQPQPSAVLELLQLLKHWGGNDEMETFDFALPDGVTNYVLCVRFDENGDVEAVEMES